MGAQDDLFQQPAKCRSMRAHRVRRQAGFDAGQIDIHRAVGAGTANLGAARPRRRAGAKALFQHGQKAVVHARIAVVGPQLLCLLQHLWRVKPIDQMPRRQVEEDRAGHFAALRPDDGAGPAAASPVPGSVSGRNRCRRCGRRVVARMSPRGPRRATRAGPRRTTVKSEVPPPISTISISVSRSSASRSRTPRRWVPARTTLRRSPLLLLPCPTHFGPCWSRAGSSSTKCTGRPMHDVAGRHRPDAARRASPTRSRTEISPGNSRARPATAVFSCKQAAAQQALERSHQAALGAAR